MNKELYEKIEKMVTDYVTEHPEPFLDAAKVVDDFVDQAVKKYDAAIERIKQEIIQDPNEINDPEQEMLNRLAKEQERIEAELAKNLADYVKTLEN